MPLFEHSQCNVLEILRPNPAPGRLRFAVFDFDGTLSLLRTGWQRVMADLMVEASKQRRELRRKLSCGHESPNPFSGWQAGRPSYRCSGWSTR